MASEISLEVLPRGKPIAKLPSEVTCSRDAPTSTIYQQLAAASGTSIHRIRVTKGSDGQLVPNAADTTISSSGLMGGSRILVKDLGPQIDWRTVYMIEYFGPLLIHPLFLQARPYIYTLPRLDSVSVAPPAPIQSFALLLITLHFFKREFETVFIHRFSAETMPLRNIFKNCAHYWLLSGVVMAYVLYRPLPAGTGYPDLLTTLPGVLLFAFGELANLNAHLVLRNLRSAGGRERGIPRGFGFGWVTCPNYLFEIVAWVGVALVSRDVLAMGLFLVGGTVQMASWARKRESRYRREFGDRYKRKRYCLIPGVY